MITYEQRMITPDDAKEMLNRMGKNRTINRGRLANLKEEMQSGRFTACPNPICFDEDGVLTDGQHRLTAIVETGIPVYMTIAYNVPSDSVIDNGLERKTGDSLYMRGIIPKDLSNDRIIAVAKRFLLLKNASHRHFTNDDIGDFLLKYQDTLLTVLSIVPKAGLCNNAAFRTAAFCALLNGVGENVISDFVHVANSGYSNGDEDSAAITFRNQAMEFKQTGNNIPNRTEAFAEQAIKDFSEAKPRRKRYMKEEHPYLDKVEYKKE